ncbi:protoporphyrinogen oxidase [Pelagicoccus sp. SDUM812005]|uniref:protoporphyrinogen oxidase n=1 Tax=Pelagicoccus sp. SDUM812005 TaxID=3041257 RepID=UPI00280D06D4|nr:protoporphyrinogen oxidase [Pelagicoccus sp. SDUM812005]MDQ8179087.1 protoporphyrinogen oxidase [Pelagicoccus sp. SDUM812005]
MQDAIILGGGISGLTAAYLAQQKGLDVSVIEKAPQPGGPISSCKEEGYLFERGPNSLLLPDPWVESFIEELGLKGQLQETNPVAHKRYIVKNGCPVAVPASPLQAIFTPLFSLKGKLGFLLEPFRKQISERAAKTETVASFVQRRMGRDFLDYAIDPFVSGVYAGDPHKLILEHAFPLMRGFERDGGSIIRGAIQYKKKRKREGTAYKKRSISFEEGLGVLPKTIARKLGNRLWLNSEAVAVNRVDEAWQVTWKRDGENFEGFAKSLLVCIPSHATKRIAWSKGISEPLKASPNLEYPPVHSLALGFRRDQIEHPLDGFGVLVPSKESPTVLGVLFSSSLYAGRAPDGHCLLTVMIGGIRHRELAALDPDKLLQIALRDLRSLLGLKGDPAYYHCSSWPKAIPQYTRDFGAWKDTLRSLEDEFSGLHFGGNSIDGIAMGASILSGKRLAAAISPSS